MLNYYLALFARLPNERGRLRAIFFSSPDILCGSASYSSVLASAHICKVLSVCAVCNMSLSASFRCTLRLGKIFRLPSPLPSLLVQPVFGAGTPTLLSAYAMMDAPDSNVEVQGTSRNSTTSYDRRYDFGSRTFLRCTRQVSCECHATYRSNATIFHVDLHCTY